MSNGPNRSAKRLAVLLLLSSSVLALVPAPGASADQGVSRDPGFGENGRVVVGPGDGGSLLYQNMTTQTDGGALVLIAGGAGGNYLARYNSNGHLDDSFGVHGKVSFSIYNSPMAFRLPTDPSAPIFVMLGTTTEHEYAVRRYQADGSPDAGFGTAGQLTVSFTGFDNTVSLAVSATGAPTVANVKWDGFTQQTIIKRFTATGAVDVSFGTAGTSTITGLTGSVFAIDSSGRSLLLHDDRADGTKAIVRLTPGGALQTSFGTAGFADLPGNNDAATAQLLDTGQIIVTARVSWGGGFLARVVRFTSAGVPDATFGVGGIVDVGFLDIQSEHSNTSEYAVPRDLVPLADGRVALLANSYSASAAAILQSNGELDPGFGDAGRAIVSDDLELLSGSMGDDGSLEFLGYNTNQQSYILQRSTQRSPWPPVSPAPQNLEAHPVEQNGYVGFAATWSPVVNPDPEVTDYGYLIEVQPDVRNILARHFPIIVTEPHGGIVPLPAGTYTVSVRSLNAFADGVAATTTVTIPPRTMPPGYVSLVPARLLDTRPDGSTVDGAMVAIGRRAAGTITEVQVVGRAGTPEGATTATVNVTVTEPTDAGFVTVYPCTATVPTASNLNYVAGQTIANTAVTKLSPTGSICIYNNAPAHLIVDTNGYDEPGSTYVPLVPARLLDSRSDGSTVDGAMVAIGKRAAGTITEVRVAGRAGTPTGATTAVVNVTVTEPAAAGFVTIYPCTSSLPNASNLNYAVGQTIANAAVVKLSPTGSICIFSSAPAHLVVDTNGYDEAESTYVPLAPVRLLDTRAYGSTIDNAMAGIGLRAGGTIIEVQVTGRAWSPPLGSLAAVVNVTVTEPTAAGFVTVYPCTGTVPTASNVNYAGGQTIANVAVTKLSATGTICIYNNTATHLLIDVSGYHQGP